MSADERFFVDTNVLLYTADPADPVRQRAARLWLTALWEQGAGSLSWQVLHEFYVTPSGNCGFPLRRRELPSKCSLPGSLSKPGSV